MCIYIYIYIILLLCTGVLQAVGGIKPYGALLKPFLSPSPALKPLRPS